MINPQPDKQELLRSEQADMADGEPYDLLGIGIGPFNLGLAALLQKTAVKAVFCERKPQFDWHSGMLLEGTTLQVPFFADLVTMADPTHPLSYLNYLHEHGRLYHFYFLERFHIPRREYNHYCQWAASKLPCCQFGSEVADVRLVERGGVKLFEAVIRDTASGAARRILARDLVLGVGSVPHVPRPMSGFGITEGVFHAADYLGYRERCLAARKITVIGSGQSAGEVFLDLLQEQRNYGYRLDWLTRSKGFLPMEYSKLGLEHFSPDYTSYFYNLPAAVKDRVRAGQDLLYKGISAKTIADIYDQLYDAGVGGDQPDVGLLALTEVEGIQLAAGEDAAQCRLSCRHIEQGRSFTHDSEIVILATGYRHAVPSCLEPLRSLLVWDEQERFEVTEDYRLVWKDREVANRIYVQNGELHTHGVGAPDLGLGAYRNSVIINGLTGQTVYPLRKRNVFQQFGLQAAEHTAAAAAEPAGAAGSDGMAEAAGAYPEGSGKA
ncbi:lysine N(6)-hydroxylase/L-ornithine N(5)-oxygenase family protein [Paenibacillus tarimensis]